MQCALALPSYALCEADQIVPGLHLKTRPDPGQTRDPVRSPHGHTFGGGSPVHTSRFLGVLVIDNLLFIITVRDRESIFLLRALALCCVSRVCLREGTS